MRILRSVSRIPCQLLPRFKPAADEIFRPNWQRVASSDQKSTAKPGHGTPNLCHGIGGMVIEQKGNFNELPKRGQPMRLKYLQNMALFPVRSPHSWLIHREAMPAFRRTTTEQKNPIPENPDRAISFRHSTIDRMITSSNPIPMPPLTRHRRGFTLVELLVVITIIIVLATVVVVMTRRIKNKAYQSNALSALRQVASFSAAYSVENNGDINTMRWQQETKTEGPPGGNTYVINTFWGRFHPYLCPDVDTRNQSKLRAELKQRLDSVFSTNTDSGHPKSDPKGRPMPGTVVSGSRIYRDLSGLAIPIAFNDYLHEFNKVLKVSSFGEPSQVLYAVYGNGFFDEADGEAYAVRPTDNTKPTNNIYYMDDQKALAAFLDGHVESLQAPIPDRKFK